MSRIEVAFAMEVDDIADMRSESPTSIAEEPKERGSEPTDSQPKPPATFHCTLCPTHFIRAYNLRSHLQTHKDERPFLCTVCGKGFKIQFDQKNHEASHLACTGALMSGGGWGCNRRFARVAALQVIGGLRQGAYVSNLFSMRSSQRGSSSQFLPRNCGRFLPTRSNSLRLLTPSFRGSWFQVVSRHGLFSSVGWPQRVMWMV